MKRAYHHKDLRNALVEEAIALLEHADAAQVSLRELARRLNVTHTAAYAHFADKTALLEAVSDVGFTRLADAIEAARDTETDARGALSAMGQAYLGFARTHPHLYRLMFADPELCSQPDQEMSPEGTRAFALLVGAMQAVGVPEGMDLQDAATGMWSMVHGISMLEIDQRISGKTMRSADEVLKLAADTYIRGLHA